MNLIIYHRQVRCPEAVPVLVERRLGVLARTHRIEQATVRLHDEPEASPRFQASVYLRVPGPDIHATSCDHTVAVAVEKALRDVEAQLADRIDRRHLRRKSNLHLSSVGRTGRAW
ncbi:MAG: HPF/RaiA family ribosome-associated protein [Opitutaceae bacterium]|nr:HPF/RaiA family ribosome-associated protein [Opitutaceae bacterium]